MPNTLEKFAHMIFDNAEIYASPISMRNVSQGLDRQRFTKRVPIISGEFITTDPASVITFDDAWFNYNFSLTHRHKLFVLLSKVTMKKKRINTRLFIVSRREHY
jgi:hypothetical protein